MTTQDVDAAHSELTQLPEDMGPRARLSRRVRRHIDWARQDGIGRLIEEDNLDPRARVSNAWRKHRWRRTHGVEPGQARAVFLVGVQRSGTNMVVHGLEASPAVEVHNENDRNVFSRYLLREDDIVRDLVMQSRHQIVLLKPLSDSHRTVELLDDLELTTPPLAIWAYRNVDDRARSAVAKFGDVNRRVLAQIAAGEGDHRWQAQGLSEQSLEFIRSVDPAHLSPESAAATFWLVRNRLYFDQRLHERDDVLLVSYEQVTADPALSMQRLASFVGLPYTPALAAHIDGRAGGGRPALDLDPRVRAACDDLQARLDAAAADRTKRIG